MIFSLDLGIVHFNNFNLFFSDESDLLENSKETPSKPEKNAFVFLKRRDKIVCACDNTVNIKR